MKRSTAAPPRMARSAMPAPPHRVSPQRSSVLRSGLDLWRGVAGELRGVSPSPPQPTQSSPASACWRTSHSSSSPASATETSQASAPASAASDGDPAERQRIGSSVTDRRSPTAPWTATASAPWDAAARAASGPRTSTITEMPSPSAMAWLNRRSLLTGRKYLLADWMPDGLELEEGLDLPGALRIRLTPHDPLHVLGRRALELRRVAVSAGQVERVHVHVRSEPRCKLGTVTGEQVDSAAGHI